MVGTIVGKRSYFTGYGILLHEPPVVTVLFTQSNNNGLDFVQKMLHTVVHVLDCKIWMSWSMELIPWSNFAYTQLDRLHKNLTQKSLQESLQAIGCLQLTRRLSVVYGLFVCNQAAFVISSQPLYYDFTPDWYQLCHQICKANMSCVLQKTCFVVLNLNLRTIFRKK